MKTKPNKNLIIIVSIAVIALIALFIITRSHPPKIRKAARVSFKGKIAIVIDDWGYNLNNMPIVNGIRYPFTASILPNLKDSREVAAKLHARGIEIMLHLPMEPKERYGLENNTITTTMDETTINKIIDHDLANIVYADGVNNHMGSCATENSRTMAIVFKNLKSKHLFFLDSYVTPASICQVTAKNINIPFVKRDIFLDNKADKAYIEQQILILKAQAKSKGWAIGIGHDRKTTLEVLKKEMPNLVKEGYKLVFISELVK